MAFDFEGDEFGVLFGNLFIGHGEDGFACIVGFEEAAALIDDEI